MVKKPTYAALKKRISELEAQIAILKKLSDTREQRSTEEKFRGLMEASPDPIVIYDMAGIVLYVNNSFTKVFGWTLEEIRGRKLDYVPEDDRAETEKMLRRLLRGEGVQGFETRRLDKDGKTLDIDMSFGVWRDQDDKPAGSVVVLHDVTRRRKLESKLQDAYKMEAIGTLAGGIAHDFNNILHSMIGYTELALEDIDAEDRSHGYLQNVLTAGARARDLVQQILTFSRNTEHEVKAVNVNFIATKALKLLRASLPATIDIRSVLKTDSMIMGDPVQIHQLIMNLCTNAAQAMMDHGGVLHIGLEDTELDSHFTEMHTGIEPGLFIQLTVTDTGHGIEPEYLDRIFDPFFTTRETGEGTGMGLSVVHGIVKSHGGAIYSYSEPDKGSTFKVFLPIVARQKESDIDASKPIPGGSERILFIDDEPMIVDIGIDLLKSLGYDVVGQTSSINALELFEADPTQFDLIITDMTMPGKTGVEVAALCLEIQPDIPIILCTGHSRRIDEEHADELGVRAVLSKPVFKRKLAETVREVLEKD